MHSRALWKTPPSRHRLHHGVLCVLLSLMGSISTALAGPNLHSPEDSPGVPGVQHEVCTSDAQCKVTLSGAQDIRCVSAFCDKTSGQCATRINSGLALGEEVLTCAKTNRVCGPDGAPQSSGKITPLNNGKVCVPSSGTVPLCQKAVCSQGQCVLQNSADDTACVDPDPEAVVNKTRTVCQKSVCLRGACTKIVADTSKVGVPCKGSIAKDCLLTAFKCGKTGACDPVPSAVAGAQCAMNGTAVVLGAAAALPAWYKALIVNSATAPKVTCTTACKLQGCGDKVVNGAEECDGSIPSSFKPAAGKTLANYDCTALCTIRVKLPCEGVVKTPSSCPKVDGEQTTSICVQNPNGTIQATWNAPAASVFEGSFYKGLDKQGLVELALRNNVGQNCWACGCWRVNGCFTPETKIVMADGSYRAVRDISAGEYVMNPVTHGPSRVTRIVQGPEKIDLVELRYGDSLLVVSSKHPMVTARGIVQAAKLTKRDLLIDRDGAKLPIASVKRVPPQEGQQVINLVLDESIPPHQRFIVAEGVQTGDLSVQLSQGKKRK
jgi:hypothetical protein